MLLWQKIKNHSKILRRIPVKYYFVAGVLLVTAVYVVAFRERTLVYNYGGQTCDQRLVVLPGLFRQAGGDRYSVATEGGWSVFGKQITASSLCMSPVEPPAENSSEAVAFAPWGGWLARLTYQVEAGTYPTVNTSVLEKEPIPVSRELHLPLSQPDVTFSYVVGAEDREAQCESMGSELACDVPALDLEQGSRYTLELEKRFKERSVGSTLSADIETLSPLLVAKSSIQQDATVYDKSQSVTIQVDKPLAKAEFAVHRIDGDEPARLEATTEFDGQQAVVTLVEELPRQATIELKAMALEAIDGSTPLDPYALVFKTSGGPRVIGVNAGSSGVAIGSEIIVTFDQDLSPDQDLTPLIAVGGGVSFQARRGNQLIFSTDGAERCAEIAIVLKPEIESPYGVSGQSGWQYKSRMRCYTISTIGHSVQGRPIYAYHFGSGGSSIVYTGAIHGSEVSTKLLMDRWIEELDANPGKIPSGKRVIVVPTINPDGFTAGKRENARNVDLNRNFAVSDWKKDIQHTDGSAFPGGGGEAPMSEPETRAIAGFIAQQQPELVVSYHSIGWLVISNQGGQANTRASQYASMSGYRLSPGGGGEFGYQITGTADDYYREKLGVPSILIELGSHSYHQFEKNQAAMWAMMR